MEKAFVAQRVAKKLFVTEAAVDGALAEASELMSEMLRARKDVHVSMVFADEAAVKMVEAIKALTSLRARSISLISSEASASAPSTAASVTNSFLATRCATNAFSIRIP